jgi:predicted ribosomally synthesized peptide with SipW-like signal peptide
MTRKKLLGSIAAIVAVLGLIGGGTLAGWTATDSVQDNFVIAGELGLDVTGDTIEISDMFPGREVERTFHLASATTNPDDIVGTLSVTMVPNNARNALWDEADIQLQYFNPTAGQGCAAGAGTTPGFYNGRLSEAAGWSGASSTWMQDKLVTTLGGVGGPTEICLRANTRLRFDRATNDSMNQQALFDLRFDLVQVNPNP